MNTLDVPSDAVDAATAALRIEAAAVQAVQAQIEPCLERALAVLHAARGRVVVSGLGKSGHVGAKIAATLASTGTPALFVHAAEALHGDSGMAAPGDAAILISNSGRTAEVCTFAGMLARRSIPIVAMTGVGDSPLAQVATVVLNVGVAAEADPLNLAPTASTTVVLAVGDALAAGLMVLNGVSPGDFAQFHPGGSLGDRLAN